MEIRKIVNNLMNVLFTCRKRQSFNNLYYINITAKAIGVSNVEERKQIVDNVMNVIPKRKLLIWVSWLFYLHIGNFSTDKATLKIWTWWYTCNKIGINHFIGWMIIHVRQTAWKKVTQTLFNSLSPGRCGCDFKCVNFKHNLGIDILSI